MSSPSGVVCAILVSAALAAGCTDYKPASDTLLDTDELASQPGGGDPDIEDLGADWSCLGGAPDRALAPGTQGAAVTYSLRLLDLATGAVLPNTTVRACGLTDITCANPITDVLRLDSEGWVNVPLTSNFQGYLEIVNANAVPYIFHLPEGLRTMRDFPLVMITLDSFGALVNALRIQPDPNLGAIGMRAFDCQGDPAPGVVLKSNTGGVAWYFENGLPNRERQQTDPDGLGGFIGSVPGVTLFEAELTDGTPTASKSIIVRAGWMTAGYMRPRAAVVAP